MDWDRVNLFGMKALALIALYLGLVLIIVFILFCIKSLLGVC